MSKTKANQPQKLSQKEIRRQELQRAKRNRALRLWGPIAALGILLVVFLLIRLLEPEVLGAVFVPDEPAGTHDLEAVIELGDLPPTGGLHSPQWQNCGIYTQPVNAANAVHALEHGAVWITYHPDLAGDQISALQGMVRGEGHLLLSPFPDQRSQVALTAWDVQLELDSVSDERITEFIDKYRNTRGPEPGASCSGGVGTPIN